MIDQELIKCPQCRAIPVDDKTPPGFYRKYGECHCEEETKEEQMPVEKASSPRPDPAIEEGHLSPGGLLLLWCINGNVVNY